MIYDSNYLEEQAVPQTAARMCAAARTAPKAHGKDTLHTFVLTGEKAQASVCGSGERRRSFIRFSVRPFCRSLHKNLYSRSSYR